MTTSAQAHSEEHLAQYASEWLHEHLGLVYSGLDKSSLPGWLATVMEQKAAHIDECLVCRDRVLDIVMRIEDLETGGDECDAAWHFLNEYGRADLTETPTNEHDWRIWQDANREAVGRGLCKDGLVERVLDDQGEPVTQLGCYGYRISEKGQAELARLAEEKRKLGAMSAEKRRKYAAEIDLEIQNYEIAKFGHRSLYDDDREIDEHDQHALQALQQAIRKIRKRYLTEPDEVGQDQSDGT